MLPVREEPEKLVLPVALAAFALAFAAGILATLAVSWQDLTRGVSLLSSAAFDRGSSSPSSRESSQEPASPCSCSGRRLG